MTSLNATISTILKYDRKNSSYKISLLRSINDVVLSFPDLSIYEKSVAVPLRLLADFWIAYYWPFVDAENPIYQGRHAKQRQDITFRQELTELRQTWEEEMVGGKSPASDGFVLVNEHRISRKRKQFTGQLIDLYKKANGKIVVAIQHPIRYAGPGEHQIFEKPKRLSELGDRVIPVPGTQPNDKCLVIQADLWKVFQDLSLWVEALCIHEWSLFSERMIGSPDFDRGDVYRLLTARPDNRRPLRWERNYIDILLKEGQQFTCPWTSKKITIHSAYDLDHLIPVVIYPTNEMWNLVPADREFNQRKKRDRLPSQEKIDHAKPHLQSTYKTYLSSDPLKESLKEDVSNRFGIPLEEAYLPGKTAEAVAGLLEKIAKSRNVARF